MRRFNSAGGIVALVVLGGIALYRNRDRVRAILERQGINVPHRGEIFDRIRTGANRVVERVSQVKGQSDEVLKEVG